MERLRFLRCLADDEARLREVAARDLDADVPSCPGWTVADLVRHVGEVYLHKVECIRTGLRPSHWPPPSLEKEDPLPLLDRAYAALVDELGRDPSAPAFTWFEPDQTVGFWVRRMAQETVIHRVDAELALRLEVTPIPDDLAVDGIDEVLHLFLAYETAGAPEAFGAALSQSDGHAVLVAAGDARWSVTPAPEGVLVGPADGRSAASVTGDPQSVLLWLWGRAGGDTVRLEGDRERIDGLRDLLRDTTQ
ncbi:maleylpyruvate isomerase family mycothiol-dependent enzyme [Phytohabitans sp. LJ34]|uniref:maleylpyruvate isomerase family mycothiol-dependent enzyme n=1 Tax=Phytohabitans sp. LJ34 TaxID=3452217 RepID=UPI003F893346